MTVSSDSSKEKSDANKDRRDSNTPTSTDNSEDSANGSRQSQPTPGVTAQSPPKTNDAISSEPPTTPSATPDMNVSQPMLSVPLNPTQLPATNLFASNVGMKTITLNFSPGADSDGIVHYKISRKDGYTVGTTTTNYITDDNVYPGATYIYTVYVVDRLGNTNPGSESLVVTTVSDIEPPTVPKNFRILSQESGKTYFIWDHSTDNSAIPNIDLEYEVYVSPEPEFYWTSGDRATVYTNPGVVYTVSVKSVDFAGNYSDAASPITFVGM